jgi:type III secretory pathway lipoprotein EscJ
VQILVPEEDFLEAQEALKAFELPPEDDALAD